MGFNSALKGLKWSAHRNENNTPAKKSVWYRIISSILMVLYKCNETFEYCYNGELRPRP